MTSSKPWKQGDLVTKKMNPRYSNVWVVTSCSKKEVMLHHPSAPTVHFSFSTSDEFQATEPLAVTPGPIERCLWFLVRHKASLNPNDEADLSALHLLFVQRRDLTSKQKAEIARMCGALGYKHFDGSMQAAAQHVLANQALLDDHNVVFFNSAREAFEDWRKVKSSQQRDLIFNIAGFILAQGE